MPRASQGAAVFPSTRRPKLTEPVTARVALLISDLSIDYVDAVSTEIASAYVAHQRHQINDDDRIRRGRVHC
ncbi:MAG: hypothetical protein WKF43_01205 [Acidimicrobiales bacterium]